MQKNILEYFGKTVAAYPGKDAVIEGDKRISFEELSNCSKALAHLIIDAVYGACNMPVALFLPKSVESITGDLAVSYSGNIYMNLDVKLPAARIKNILASIRPALIITNTANSEKLGTLCGRCPILNIDDLNRSSFFDDRIISERLERLIDTDPLCIINTSGSTGTPKGVVLNHRSFIDFTEWAIETLKIGDNEIVGSLSPLVFDIYSFELCMMMAKGSTLVLIPDTLAAFPANLLSMIREKMVSFIFWVPTIMVNIANMDLLSRIPLPELKTVWFAGEVFPTKQYNYWKGQLPSAKFVNLYGPIEITLDCTYFVIDRELSDNEPIPIGFPCKNTDILILNQNNEPSAINEMGELCVRGTSLAMGYYNDPQKTASAFVQNPLNTAYPEIIYRTGDLVSMNERGEIIFKGRKDTMIKHFGYRIELCEIEHIIINTLKLAENGCIVYDSGKKEIVLFYESKADIPAADMRKNILTLLPKYMVPNRFIRKDELPRNTSGKIDRLFLHNEIANNSRN